MRRKPPGPEEFVSSTTRAVAWGALFFSLLALLISMVTLFLTWHDGQLVKNSRLLLDGVDKAVQNWSASRGPSPDASGAASEADDPAMPLRVEKIRDKITRLEAMVDAGDERAKYYLDNLVEELGPLRDYTSETTSQWVGQAVETLKSTREQIRDNAPGAVRNLKALSDSLRKRSGAETAPPDETPGADPTDDPLNFDLDLDDQNP